MLDTSCSWPSKVFLTVNVCMLQSFIDISVLQDASVYPFWWKAIPFTMPEWPFKVRSCSPYSTSQRRIVVSSLAETTRGQAGWEATFTTLPLWPYKQYFSGSLGNPSPILNCDEKSPCPSHFGQDVDSLTCESFFSSSIVLSLSLATEDHFFSKLFICSPEAEGLWVNPDSALNASTVCSKLFKTRYSRIDYCNSSFYALVSTTITLCWFNLI